MDKKENS